MMTLREQLKKKEKRGALTVTDSADHSGEREEKETISSRGVYTPVPLEKKRKRKRAKGSADEQRFAYILFRKSRSGGGKRRAHRGASPLAKSAGEKTREGWAGS